MVLVLLHAARPALTVLLLDGYTFTAQWSPPAAWTRIQDEYWSCRRALGEGYVLRCPCELLAKYLEDCHEPYIDKFCKQCAPMFIRGDKTVRGQPCLSNDTAWWTDAVRAATGRSLWVCWT